MNSVAELEYQLAEKSGIPIFEQRLIFGGKQLSNQHNLLDYGLSDGNTINLALRSGNFYNLDEIVPHFDFTDDGAADYEVEHQRRDVVSFLM